LRPHIDLVV